MSQETKLSHVPSAWDHRPEFNLGIVPLQAYLKHYAITQPDKNALIYYGKKFTYKEYDETVDRLANALYILGVRKGDKVTVFLPNCPQYLFSYFALQRIGAVLVSANPMFKKMELNEAMKDTDSIDIICLDQLYPVVKEIRNEVTLRNVIVTSYHDFLPEKPEIPLYVDMMPPKITFPDTMELTELLQKYQPTPPEIKIIPEEDPAIILFTGGTTGRPKPCMHTFYNQTYKAPFISEYLKTVGLDKNEQIILLFLPIFHRMAQLQTEAYLFTGATIVLLTKFDALCVLKAVQEYECTALNPIVAPVLESLLNHPDVEKYDLTSLKKGITTAQTFDTPLPNEYLKKWSRLTRTDLCAGSYGLTETLARDTMTKPGEILPVDAPVDFSYMGLPTYNTEIKLAHPETGQIVPEGEIGEIMIKSPTLMKGYYKMPQETAQQITEDGWLHTGDLGKIGKDGYLYHKGRIKEMLKRSGWSVFPTEIEDLLRKHPAIVNAVVIGVPDPRVGQEVKAFVEIAPEYMGKIGEEELIRWCKENMSSYKYPRIIEFKTIPLDMVGKTARKALR